MPPKPSRKPVAQFKVPFSLRLKARFSDHATLRAKAKELAEKQPNTAAFLLEKSVAGQKGFGETLGEAAVLYAKAGNAASAERILKELENRQRQTAARGFYDEIIAKINQALKQSKPGYLQQQKPLDLKRPLKKK